MNEAIICIYLLRERKIKDVILWEKQIYYINDIKIIVIDTKKH